MEISREVNEIILKSYDFAKSNKDEFITAEHLLYGITFEDRFINALEELNYNAIDLRKKLDEYISEYIEEGNTDSPVESYSFQQAIIKASEQAIFSSKKSITMEHLISAIYDLENSYASFYLQEEGIEKRDLLYKLCHENYNNDDYISEGLISEENEEIDNEINVNNKKDLIKTLTVNLNEQVKGENSDPLIGREEILERTIQILCRRTKNNPIHVGEPGVGKTAITLGLARLINSGNVPEKLKNAEIFSLDIGAALAGTKYRGDFEERIKKVLNEIELHENPIVYIDEIHNIVGAGAIDGGALDMSNLLKPYLVGGKVKFIGATTFDEYKKYFEKDKALSRRFQTIEVKETSIEETIKIINGLKSNYESYHNVKYTNNAIKIAVELSSKYINDRFLPDKAIDIIDEAGAYASMNRSDLNEVLIDEKVIEDVISRICHIPKNTVEKDEVSSLKDLEKNLEGNIFGQDKAIHEVVRCIKISRAGLNNENKPISSLLFVGPTGVGKTEVAKTLANSLGVKLIRFDMSEYAEKHAAAKLIGAPPGYVGYEEGGLLTDTIRKNPYCVLLLDEVEKAHPDILNVLLQVMDYATLSDNQGRKADFRNVILIMTSNAGAKDIGKSVIGFGERVIQGEAIMEEVKKFFTPEFRNRLDKIVVFNHLNKEMALNIARRELNKFNEQLLKKNVKITFDEECVKFIAKNGTSQEYGAREIIRIINQEIKPMLVDEILFGKLSNGGEIAVTNVDGKFIYS
ncbi:MAG: ATP-dependent Clp protease ATP-binding subunit ClpA [Clostridium saudiense]|uniref:ATP-dependent Clp protease ATP-binding subunit ClpA n=1 Tax=Clostridium saudiense TaxID=1414720 RepID=UPI00290CC370|nr:ATP-dependent Clp protease ATP-binding subunit ClpA [Clostridium saudiense]MDU3521371.1 ATP-dependent Clp protease ATP-binding subunit ClpA [Clostridium saudiense]